MNAPLQVALVGLEHPHCDFWAAAFRQSNQARLIGVWSTTAGLSAQKAEQYACRHWPDRDALIAASDAVAICATTAEHAGLISAAALAGKKILCEKPLANSFDACAQIEAIVERTGAYFMQGFPKRFDPLSAQIKALVDNGDIGKVNLVRIRHGHPYAALGGDFRNSWFADPRQAGGGALLDEGVHGADFLHWLCGVPASVTCTMATHTPGLQVEDVAVAVFRYADGTIGEITSSWLFLGADNSVEIYGADGTIVVSGIDLGSRDLTDTAFLKHYRRPGPEAAALNAHTLRERRWIVAATVPQFKVATDVFHGNVARAFVEHAAADRAPPVTLGDGLIAARMILTAYRAAASGRSETLVGAV